MKKLGIWIQNPSSWMMFAVVFFILSVAMLLIYEDCALYMLAFWFFVESEAFCMGISIGMHLSREEM